MLMLAAAVVVVVRRQDELVGVMRSLAAAPVWAIAVLAILPLLNLGLSSLTFLVLMRRHGRVGVVEMAALIGSAWLLNYFPMRPGLVGRVAYHKAVNQIRVRDSARVVVESVAGSAVATALVVFETVSVQQGGWWNIIAGGVVAIVVGAAIGSVVAPGSSAVGAYCKALVFKVADVVVWMARYMLVFWLVGLPLAPAHAAAIAAVSQAAMLVPLVGNGLGLREWAVGLLASSLPSWYLFGAGVGASVEMADGLAADLLNRGVEVVLAIPVGLAAAGYLARRAGRSEQALGGHGGPH